jgi:hypothetical protein
MTKDQASAMLKQVIDQLKLTRQEYETLCKALSVLAGENETTKKAPSAE